MKKNAAATFTFTGRAVAWIAPRGAALGKAKVYLDGKYVATVDLKTASAQNQRVVFAYSWTASKSHKMQIVCQATSGRPRIEVDAFAVMK